VSLPDRNGELTTWSDSGRSQRQVAARAHRVELDTCGGVAEGADELSTRWQMGGDRRE